MKTHFFAWKTVFQLHKNGEFIPENERMAWRRQGDKIILSVAHENYN